ncbi:acyl-CoA dehydrogenase family protein [Nocardia sp. NPDC048505]|uniref:acyl-CoA dehydrogenase family protein n=1 Tax=unclassified Nocardia TaxID=2637762 RepID=UPI0033E021B4
MDVELCAEAVEFGRQARRAFAQAGGDTLLQQAERYPHRRGELVAPILAGLGAWDLAPRSDSHELQAAAALCRSAGYWAVPYPVAERLARPADGGDGLVVISGSTPRGPLAGLDYRWAAVTLEGTPGNVTVTHTDAPPRATAFCAPLTWHPIEQTPSSRIVLAEHAAGRSSVATGNGEPVPGERGTGLRASLSAADWGDGVVAERHPGEAGRGERAAVGRAADRDGAADLALGLVLPCWTLLGMLDRAMDLARAHVLVREQFGQPLAEFQGVQFQLTDAEVERRGVEMLARYALWAVAERRPERVEDALALRVAALEAAEVVFRVAHQVHGALGFCDESPLSWLSRYSLPLRRLPVGSAATEELLTRRIGRRGLTGLFAGPANAKGA